MLIKGGKKRTFKGSVNNKITLQTGAVQNPLMFNKCHIAKGSFHLRSQHTAVSALVGILCENNYKTLTWHKISE